MMIGRPGTEMPDGPVEKKWRKKPWIGYGNGNPDVGR